MQFLKILILTILISNSAFSQDAISISAKMPYQASSGTNYTVELTFQKFDMRNFAVFKQKFPKGFHVSENFSADADFKFEDNELSYIWFRLPKSEKYSLKYDVRIDSTVTGAFTIAGRMTYIAENMRGSADLSPLTITVKKEKVPTLYTESKTAVKTEKVADNTSETKKMSDSKENTDKPTGTVSCKRTEIKLNNSSEYLVSLKISKGKLQTTVKLSEKIPEGFKAEQVDIAGATFRFENREVSILWNKVPIDEVINIIYKLIPLDKNKIKKPEIQGQMLFIKNGKVVKTTIQ